MDNSINLPSGNKLRKKRKEVSIMNQARLAIQNKNLAKFRHLVTTYGFSKLSNGDNGILLLRHAVCFNSTSIAKFIIKRVIDVNKIEENDSFPSLLHAAVEKDNREIVRALLSKGINLNIVDKQSRSPLGYAVQLGQFRLSELLIENGATLDVNSEIVKHCFFSAVHTKNVPALNLLFLLGVSVNSNLFPNGNTPLHLACGNGDEQFVQFLLENKSDINFPNSCHITPIIEALYKNRVKIVKLLLNYGACLTSTSTLSQTLTFASAKFDMIYLLLDVNGERSPHIELTLEDEYSDVILLLLQKGAKVYKHFLYHAVINEFFRSSVTESTNSQNCSFNRLDLIEPLINSGADLHYIDRHGKNVLYYAVEIEDCPLIIKFLQLGLSVESCHKEGIYLIYMAIDSCNLELIELLLNACSDVNIKDTSGDTILNKAVETFSLEVVRLVLKFVKTVDKDCGEKCFNFLFNHIKNGRSSRLQFKEVFCCIVRDLFNCGSKVSENDFNEENFILAIKMTSYELVSYFLDAGMDPNVYCAEEIMYESALEVACEEDSTEIALLLVQCGADVKNMEAIVCALRNRNLKIIQCFLDKGIGMEMEDFLYLSVKLAAANVVQYLLGLGMKYNLRAKPYLLVAIQSTRSTVLTMLINHGVPLDGRDSFGNTALHAASVTNSVRCIRTLIEFGADVNLKNSLGQTVVQYVLASTHNFLPTPLLKHVIILKLIGKHLENNYDYIACIKMLPSVDSRFMDCVMDEIDYMKEIKICNSSITYYDLLIDSDKKTASCLRNSEILRSLSPSNINTMFPFCGYMLVLNLIGVAKRLILQKKGEQKLWEIIQELGILPLEMVQKICWYLNTDDLQLLSSIPHNLNLFSELFKE